MTTPLQQLPMRQQLMELNTDRRQSAILRQILRDVEGQIDHKNWPNH